MKSFRSILIAGALVASLGFGGLAVAQEAGATDASPSEPGLSALFAGALSRAIDAGVVPADPFGTAAGTDVGSPSDQGGTGNPADSTDAPATDTQRNRISKGSILGGPSSKTTATDPVPGPADQGPADGTTVPDVVPPASNATTPATPGASDAPASAESVTASFDKSRKTVTIVAKGGEVAKAQNVAICVTCDGSADHEDTLWYQATLQKDGSWKVTFDADEVGEGGVCTAQVFLAAGDVSKASVSTTFSAAGLSGKVDVTELDEQFRFEVTASDARFDTPAETLVVEVRENDVSKWYDLVSRPDGTWGATIPLSDFGMDQGTYRFVTYACADDGIPFALSYLTREVDFGTPTVVESTIDSKGDRLWLVAADGAVQYAWNVAFCVTDSRGDITWVPGVLQPDGSWSADIDAEPLGHGTGNAVAHANIGDESVAIGMDTFYQSRGGSVAMAQVVKDYSSSTEYLIAINTEDCLVGVYTGKAGDWKLLHYWECSCGASGTPTVTGVFTVGYKGYYFDSYGSRCFYYTQFYGEYYFHSTLYWPTLTYPDSSNFMDARTGLHLSHGCVRLDLDNAKWIWDNIPSGTTVVSY